MSLEDRLTDTFNDVLRTSGYIFEIINNNKRQSNLIAGPNNQLIPGPVTNQLAKSIAQFDLILDETLGRFNDARWCVEQIVDNRQRQEELKAQEEMERQKKAESERKKKEEEEAARKKKEDEEARAKEASEREKQAKEQQEREQKARDEQKKNVSASGAASAAANNSDTSATTKGNSTAKTDGLMMDSAFDLDLDLDKDQDLLNPLDILSTISYKDGSSAPSKLDASLDSMNLDFDDVLSGGQSVLEDLNMDLLDQDFDAGQGMEEEFDVDTFLNQIGNGDWVLYSWICFFGPSRSSWYGVGFGMYWERQWLQGSKSEMFLNYLTLLKDIGLFRCGSMKSVILKSSLRSDSLTVPFIPRKLAPKTSMESPILEMKRLRYFMRECHFLVQ